MVRRGSGEDMASRHRYSRVAWFFLFFCLSIFHSLHAEMRLNLGFGSAAFYDSNPALHSATFEFLQDSYGLTLIPNANFHLSTAKNDLDLECSYLEESYSDTTNLKNLSGFSIVSAWSQRMSDTFRFSLSNNFKQSMMDREDRDIPEVTGIVRWNELQSGIAYGKENDFILKAHGIWSIKRNRDGDFQEYSDLYQLESWNEYGAAAFFQYYLIPEISLLTNIMYLKRKFSDYESVPGHAQSIGSFGFKTHLPYGTDIQTEILIYVYEFEGEIPRRMKAEYTNFGVALEINHPFSPGWKCNIKAGSVYEISERSPRYFYHLETISAQLEYRSNRPYVFRSRIRHSKLDYLGQEPRIVVYETLAGLTLGYKITNWLEINGFYWFLQRSRELPEYDTETDRLGIGMNVMVPLIQ